MSMPAVCYLLSNYRSHRRAGLDNRQALMDAGVRLVDDPGDAEVVVLHDEPWSYPGFLRAYPVLRERHVIAYAVWEPDRLPPDGLRRLGLVNEIWTSSSYCREIMQAAGRPVTIIPHIVAPAVPDKMASQALRARLGLDESRFIFYTISKIEERKNIEAGIRAFARAFPDGGPAYVVKTPGDLPADLAALPGVIAWSDLAGDSEIAALHDIGDCLVSPHCAEGWGLCMSDAMSNGNLVVATGFSGNMEYMNDDNSLPVDFALEVIRTPDTRARFGFSTQEPRWAYVDEDDLCRKLRSAHYRWSDHDIRRAAAKASMTRFSAQAVGQRMVDRLTALSADQAEPGARLRLVRFG
ncbi:MAG: hypothetical protein ABIQ51_16190 [Mesorhizobium sp.]